MSSGDEDDEAKQSDNAQELGSDCSSEDESLTEQELLASFARRFQTNKVKPLIVSGPIVVLSRDSNFEVNCFLVCCAAREDLCCRLSSRPQRRTETGSIQIVFL